MSNIYSTRSSFGIARNDELVGLLIIAKRSITSSSSLPNTTAHEYMGCSVISSVIN